MCETGRAYITQHGGGGGRSQFKRQQNERKESSWHIFVPCLLERTSTVEWNVSFRSFVKKNSKRRKIRKSFCLSSFKNMNYYGPSEIFVETHMQIEKYFYLKTWHFATLLIFFRILYMPKSYLTEKNSFSINISMLDTNKNLFPLLFTISFDILSKG